MYKKISILILIFVILISCKNTEGTLVIYDLNENKYIIHNKERAEQKF